MRDDLKFRAWDKRLNKYVNPTGHFIEFDGEIWFNDGDISCDQLYSQGDHLIVEQYTGLKDKNGTEIFEGDIIEGPTFPRRLVEWNPVTCGFNCLEADEEALGDGASVVIGNRFEHPHLLEEA